MNHAMSTVDSAPRESLRGRHAIRALCLLNGIAYFVVAAGLYERAEWATRMWPWADVGMSFVFLASIAAAIGAPSIWIGLTGEFAALAGIGINTMAVNAPASAYLIWRSVEYDEQLSLPIAVSLSALLLGLLVYRWSRRLPTGDPQPMPAVVRIAFMCFATTLIAVGVALGLQTDRVFPWSLAPVNSTIFGFIFLGAAVYFIHAVLRSTWTHAAAPLWAFLAYDLVLFMPYLQLLGAGGEGAAKFDEYGSVGGINMPSLAVYLTVLSMSALLALYMLFVRPSTRVYRRRAETA